MWATLEQLSCSVFQEKGKVWIRHGNIIFEIAHAGSLEDLFLGYHLKKDTGSKFATLFYCVVLGFFMFTFISNIKLMSFMNFFNKSLFSVFPTFHTIFEISLSEPFLDYYLNNFYNMHGSIVTGSIFAAINIFPRYNCTKL